MKQKLRFLASIPFVVGVFIIVYVALGMVYFNKENETRGLTSQVLVMRSALGKPLPNTAELQTRLDDVRAESEAVLAALPSAEQGIDVYGALVELGNQGNIEIMRMEAFPPVVRKDGIGGKTILPYAITVRGSQEDTLAFVSSLIQGAKLLRGLELTNVSVKRAASEDGEIATELELNIHTWPDFNLAEASAGQVSGGKK
ncbi:MAG: type 4a pilus biogenesis protein PilO [Dehalococcoidia bacterium]|nr:type 4a pilus biogenesis protein PilO [Dehalococcoidia bacterium]